MVKGTNQKLKIVYLMKILLSKTDEKHSITMSEIISELAEYGITAERKSLYDDIEALRTYGLDILGEKNGKSFSYRVVSRQFELAELKLLVDSVQSAKFITEKKSNELIGKIEGLASKHEAKQLQRQVFVAERVKTINENIYYNVDKIHTAICENSKITFQYFQWNIKKEMELKRNGDLYEVSPWALSWDDENYYLIAYDSDEDKVKHFRVDKMLHIELKDESREGSLNALDTAEYARKTFGMYGGEECNVKLECENGLVGVMIDRFGKNIIIHRMDDGHFTTNVKVAVSKQFLGWIFSLGEGVKIVGPKKVVEQMREETERLVRQYGK